MPTDRRTDMTKLIVAFHNFMNAPKNETNIHVFWDVTLYRSVSGLPTFRRNLSLSSSVDLGTLAGKGDTFLRKVSYYLRCDAVSHPRRRGWYITARRKPHQQYKPHFLLPNWYDTIAWQCYRITALNNYCVLGRHISVGTAISYGLDGPMFGSRQRQYILSRPTLGSTELHIQSYRCSLPAVKAPLTWICPFNLSSAEVKNEWRYTSTPLVCLHGVNKNIYFNTIP